VARKHAYLRRRAGLSALLEDSLCCGASGNGFISGLGAGRESPRLTPGLARYNLDPRTITSPGSDRSPLLQQSSIRTIQASEVQVTDFLIHGLPGLPGRYIIRAGQGSPCRTRSDVKALTASYLNDSRGRSGKPTTLEDFVKKFGFRGN
jgi:hypothetical protein